VNYTKIEELAEDTTAKLGSKEVTGPAFVVRGWELAEISIVPIPANANALRKFCEQQDMSGLKPVVDGLSRTLIRLSSSGESQPAEDAPENTENLNKKKEDAIMKDGTNKDAPKPKEEQSAKPDTPTPDQFAERKAADAEIMRLAKDIFGGGDEYLTIATEQCALEADVTAARKLMLEKFHEGSKAVGTPPEPEHTQDSADDADTHGFKKLGEVPADQFAAALCG
jgi:hypothetical protein